MVAVGIGSVTADLQDIPNGPIRFMVLYLISFNEIYFCLFLKWKNDPTNRTRGDDASIAWTWRSFIENTSNIYVPLNLPMTKV